jgi:4'-phosphopantetheinyl transferase
MERKHHIAVWTVALDEVPDALWPLLGALLDCTERSRADRFVFERHRYQYIAAHALKRLMLSNLGGSLQPHEWQFEVALGGKPRVSRLPAPHFNLSHCEGLAACAVSFNFELGIDIELVTQDAPFEVVDSHFTSNAQRWLANQPPSERAAGFFRLWTLKEAFIKATGRGLVQSLQGFSFGFDPLGVCFNDQALGNASFWKFEQRVIGGKHQLALAWRSRDKEASLEVCEVQLAALLRQSLGETASCK